MGIVGDRTIHLSRYVSEKKYPEELRLVEFYDAEKVEVITFLTNNIELGPLVIANIYRNQWQIETFFKWIEGNLTVKALWGSLRTLPRSIFGSQSVRTFCSTE